MYKTLIIVESDDSPLADKFLNVISFDTYLRDYPKKNEPKIRLINLCDTDKYLSRGYYCSLLAEARKHAALPSVETINELRHGDDQQLLSNPLLHLLQQESHSFADKESVWIFFGKTRHPKLQQAAKLLFRALPTPIIQLVLHKQGPVRIEVKRGSPSSLPAEEHETFIASLSEFTRSVWQINNRSKKYRWDMAILVNPKEKVPPSNKDALNKFVKAAAQLGIKAQLLSQGEIENINHFDALFIRETTAIDHHTYRLARAAETQGVIVMDDPASILRCCNKIYLHDAFSYQGVPSLKTSIISDTSAATIKTLENEIGFPLVLKMPEGSFSDGVYKVEKPTDFANFAEKLFAKSSLLLAQEYCFTEFDWRIGVLNHRAIYACRYKMARDHWQIYNHSSKRHFSGGFETLPTFEVPQPVLKAAIKACATVGSGLYGVDIKEKDKHVYVLEVNDNPSIDHKIEDAYLGNALYTQIMAEFQCRLEARGKA